MNTDEIRKQIRVLGRQLREEARPLTKGEVEAIKDRFGRHNISTQGVYVGEDHIIIDNVYTNKTWQYYAGFEYIEDVYCIALDEMFIYSDEASRVDEVMELLAEAA